MLRLGVALRARGHTIDFVFPDPEADSSRNLASEMDRAALSRRSRIGRGQGVRPFRDRCDVETLAELFRETRPDIVHCWHTRDHVLALRARRKTARDARPVIVRSYRSAEPVGRNPFAHWLLGPGCDGLLCVSPATAERLRPLRGGRPILGRLGTVDLATFCPGQGIPRETLGFPPDAVVVGIVARMQRHRRFDLLLGAFARVVRECPRARLLVVGRGSHREEVAMTPARAMGLGERIHFAGYRDEDYAALLRTVDIMTFLVPGSDGSCRALLEAFACGIPAVTTARGALAEINDDGISGLVVAEQEGALATGIRSLYSDRARREQMGLAARSRAEQLFDETRAAAEVDAFYEEVVAGGS